jgi:carnitine-CoA ligase
MSATAPETVAGIVRAAAERWGERPFLVHGGRSVRTFADLAERSERLAAGLAAHGIGVGDRVAIMLDNQPEYVDAWLGISRLGAVEVSINTAFRGQVLAYQLGQSGTSAVVVGPAHLEVLGQVLADLPALRLVVVVGDDVPGLSGVTTLGLAELAATEPDHGLRRPEGHEPAMLAYTSGTTGRSKGVVLPHLRLSASASDMVDIRAIGSDDTLYTCLPLFHGNAKNLTTLPALLAGARLVLGTRFSASGFWDEVGEATQFNYLGVMIAILNKTTPAQAPPVHRLRLGWGAGAPLAVTEEFERRFGVTLLEGYGLTEAGVVLSSRAGARRVGTCGKPVPGYDVRVVDALDRPVGEGEVGEIVVRPERPFTTMLEYHGYPVETVETFRNCWLHTGDLARRDADGFFSFVDRQKDAIRRRGENISSREVEEVINSHPDVLESAVVAMPSEVTEDDVRAVVVLRPGASLTADELHAFCVAEMPAFWVPRYLEVGPEPLPRTPTNKIEKFRLVSAGLGPGAHDFGAGRSSRPVPA